MESGFLENEMLPARACKNGNGVRDPPRSAVAMGSPLDARHAGEMDPPNAGQTGRAAVW